MGLENIVVLDTETTGLNQNGDDEVIEIAIVNGFGKVLVNTLVKPTKRISESSILVHGISNEMVANQPTWDLIYPDVVEALKGKTVLIFNENFDLTILSQTGINYFLPDLEIETECVLMRCVYQLGRFLSLDEARELFKIKSGESHRALFDALDTLALYQKLQDKQLSQADLIKQSPSVSIKLNSS